MRKAWSQVNVNYVLSKSESDDDNERDSGGPRREQHLRLHAGVGTGATRPPAPVQRLRAVLPARQLRRHRRASASCPACRSTRRWAEMRTTAPRRAGPALQRAGRALPAQRVPQRAVQGSEPARAVGSNLAGGDARCSSPPRSSTCSTGTTSSWRATPSPTTAPAPRRPTAASARRPTRTSCRSPTTIPTSATAGQLIRTNNPGAPRQVQLGVRFQF